nr:hypothetical protein [Bacillaceae bacterium]
MAWGQASREFHGKAEGFLREKGRSPSSQKPREKHSGQLPVFIREKGYVLPNRSAWRNKRTAPGEMEKTKGT